MTDQPLAVDLAQLIEQEAVQAPPKVLTQEDKEQLADEGTPFTINNIAYGDEGEFGPYFEFSIVLDGKPATFRLSSNEKRDPYMESLAVAAAQQPISGVALRAINTRGGNKFLTITPANGR